MGMRKAETGGRGIGGVFDRRRALAVLLFSWGTGCDEAPSPVEAPAEPTPVDCDAAPQVTWATWGEGFFRNYCTGCHSSQNSEARFGAPPAVDLDTEAAALAMAARIRVRVLEQHDMPRGGGIPAEDLVLLERYLDCAEAR